MGIYRLNTMYMIIVEDQEVNLIYHIGISLPISIIYFFRLEEDVSSEAVLPDPVWPLGDLTSARPSLSIVSVIFS